MEPTKAEVDAVLALYDFDTEVRLWRRVEHLTNNLHNLSGMYGQALKNLRDQEAEWRRELQRERAEADARERKWRWFALCAWLAALLCAAGWIGGLR
jgi:anti-sigma factor RsiW